MNTEELRRLKAASFLEDKNADLIDIKTIQVDGTKKKSDRILEYIENINNPYLFRVGNTVVQVRFAEGNNTLQDSIINILSNA